MIINNCSITRQSVRRNFSPLGTSQWQPNIAVPKCRHTSCHLLTTQLIRPQSWQDPIYMHMYLPFHDGADVYTAIASFVTLTYNTDTQKVDFVWNRERNTRHRKRNQKLKSDSKMADWIEQMKTNLHIYAWLTRGSKKNACPLGIQRHYGLWTKSFLSDAVLTL